MSDFYKLKILGLMKNNAAFDDFVRLGLGEKFHLDDLLLFLKERLFQTRKTKAFVRNLYYFHLALDNGSVSELNEMTCLEMKKLSELLEDEMDLSTHEILESCVHSFESFQYDEAFFKEQQYLSELKEKNDLIHTLEEQLDQSEVKICELKNQAKNLSQTVKKLEKKIEELLLTSQKRIEKMKKKNDKLQQKNDKLQQLVYLLSEQNKRQSLEVKSSSVKKKSSGNCSKEFETFLQQQLYKKVCDEKKILASCNEKGFEIDEVKLQEQIKHLWDTKSFSVLRFEANKGQQLSLVPSSFRALLISDLHIFDIQDKTKEKIHALYEYATKNDISYIINLGDVFGYMKRENPYMDQDDAYETVDLISDLFPKKTSISHLVLGGNHDESLKEFGIDPLEFLASKNPLVYPLGYQDSLLHFNEKDLLLLLHPYKRFNDKNALFSSVKVESFLQEYYKMSGIKKEDLAFTFLGHLHLNHINDPYSFAVVPSLFKDRVCNGAMDVEFSFENNRIQQIVLSSLSASSDLQKVNEVVLERKK